MGNDLQLPENLGIEFETEEETLRHLTEDKIVTSQYFSQNTPNKKSHSNDFKARRKKTAINYPIFVPVYYLPEATSNHNQICLSQKTTEFLSRNRKSSSIIPVPKTDDLPHVPKIENCNNLEDCTDPDSTTKTTEEDLDLQCSQYFQSNPLEGIEAHQEQNSNNEEKCLEPFVEFEETPIEESSVTSISSPKTPTRENSTQAKRSSYFLSNADCEASQKGLQSVEKDRNTLKFIKSPNTLSRSPTQTKRSPYFQSVDEDGSDTDPSMIFQEEKMLPSNLFPQKNKGTSPNEFEASEEAELRCSQYFLQETSSPNSPEPGSSLLGKLKNTLSQLKSFEELSQIPSQHFREDRKKGPQTNSQDFDQVPSFEISEDPYGSIEIVPMVSKSPRKEDLSISSEEEPVGCSKYFSQETSFSKETTQKQSLRRSLNFASTEEPLTVKDANCRKKARTKTRPPRKPRTKERIIKKIALNGWEALEELEEMEVCKEFQPNNLHKFTNTEMKKRRRIKLTRSDSPKIPPGGLKPLWTPPKSPHCLIEEEYVSNPWGLLVATIFLNKTSGRQAKPYIDSFLKKYPTPQSVISKKPEDFECYFEELGLKKRSEQIWKMSKDFLEKNWRNARELHGIGKYGDDAFRLFCIGDLKVEPNDRYLKIYHRWVTNKDKWKE